MPAATAFLIDGPSADASGMETTSSGRILVHRGVDQLGHRDHVEGLGGAVLDADAGLLAGGDDSVFDHRPEGIVGLAVRDDNDADVVGGDGRRREGRSDDECRRRGDGRFDQAFHAISSFMGDIALRKAPSPD